MNTLYIKAKYEMGKGEIPVGLESMEVNIKNPWTLRVTVKDASKVTDATLKRTGASGVIKKGTGVQIIYGPKVTVIKSQIEDIL